ncbi:ribosome silencing factor [Candidatus Margulisiibacteriota bacterium]
MKKHTVKNKQNPEDKMLKKILKVLEDKKAEDIQIFKVQDLVSYTDYFVFCTGTSNPHLKALHDSIKKDLKKDKHKILGSGAKDSGWVVLDCGMVVVHCLNQKQRDRYRLEELWQDADIVHHHY